MEVLNRNDVGADENVRDKFGYTPSYWAHKEKFTDILELLPAPQKRTQQELYDYMQQVWDVHGFKPGKRTNDIAALLKEILVYSTTWSRKVYIASQDVATAFDSMQHEPLLKNLQQRGLHPDYILALMRELR